MRCLVRLLALAPLLALSISVAAQERPAGYPNRPVKIVVPFPAGGPSDVLARMIGQKLTEDWGQPVIVENRPGANTVLAAQQVVKAAPDGYTLLYATNTAFNWVPATRKQPPYNPVADFTPVSLIGYFGFFLFTNPSVPATTVAELLAYARANPGKLNAGTGNSTSQLLTAQLADLEKLDIVPVPYKGDAPLTIDLLGGRVQMAFATPGSAAPQVKEGKLRALAAMFPNRSPLLPEVPTAAEAGLGKLSITAWGGVFGPARMPKEVVDRLARELATVLQRPDVREAFGKIAFGPKHSTPDELAAFLKVQMEAWRRTAESVGIKPE